MSAEYIKHIKRLLLCLTAVCVWLPLAKAQGTVVQMRNGGVATVDLCATPTGTIVDDGGSGGNYSNGFSGTVTLTATPGMTIRLSGYYTTETNCDIIRVTDLYGSVLASVSGNSSLLVTTTSGMMQVEFTSDGAINNQGFVLNWSLQGVSTLCSNAVSNLATTNITSATADLAWSATDASGPFIVMLDGAIADGTVTGTTYTLTGIAPGSRHEAAVLSAADGGNRCCGSSTAFRTACGVGWLPMRESFEDLTAGTFPPCWTSSTNFDASGWQPQVDGLHASDGLHSLMLSSGDNATAGHFGMVLAPDADLDGTHYACFMLQGSHVGTAVVVGLCDSTSSEYNSFGFTPVDTIYTTGTDWQLHRVQFTAGAGQSRVAWRMVQGMQNGIGRCAYIDDISIVDCGIASLTAQHVGHDRMEVVWETFGNPTVTIGVRRWGAASDEATYTTATSPLEVTGLDADTWYEIRAYADCGSAGLSTSIRVHTTLAPVSASSLCLDLSRPDLPDGWTKVIPGTGSLAISTGIAHAQGKVYLISPTMAGLAGTTFVAVYAAEDSASTITFGTCLYDGDTTGFTPFLTLAGDGDRRTVAVTVPATADGTHLALRFNSPYGRTQRLYDIFGTPCPVTGIRVMHTLGTSVVLKWDPVPPTDTVLVRYWRTSGSSNNAVTRTYIGGSGAVVDGLTPYTAYTFMVYGSCRPPCPGSAFTITTQHTDPTLPYCEDFGNLTENQWIAYAGDWLRGAVFGGCPRFSAQPYYYNAGDALELASFGFESDHYSTAVLPDMVLDTGSVLSFYATSLAPQSQLLLAVRHTTVYRSWYEVFDTIQLAAGATRRHYTSQLPDSIVASDGRLAFIFRHTSQYQLYRCYIDELQIGTMAYGTATVASLDSTSANIVITNLVGDSVRITVYETGATTPVATYTYALPLPDTITLGGLTQNTLYLYFVEPLGSGTGCNSYAGYIFTPHNVTGGGSGGGGGVGDPLANCFNFDSLLSWELPGGWAFTYTDGTTADAAVTDDHLAISPHSVATIYASNRRNEVFSLRARSTQPGDTLILALIDTSYVPNSDSIISSLPTYAPLATIILDTVWQYFAITLPNSATAAKHVAMLSGAGTLHIDNIVFSQCAKPTFDVAGDNIIVTSVASESYPYLLDITPSPTGSGEWGVESGESGVESGGRYFIVDHSPYRISSVLKMDTPYDISWQCPGNIRECWPTETVHTGDGVPLPYCFRFDDFASVIIPESWTFVLDSGGTVRPSNTWAPSIRLQSTNYHYQYAILPPLSTSGGVDSTLSLRLSVFDKGQLGILNLGTDTSSFVPLLDLDYYYNTYSIDLSAYIGKRVAIRTTGYVDIIEIEVNCMSLMHYSLVAADRLKVWTEADDDYYVDIYYGNEHTADTVAHISRNPDTITLRTNREVHLRQLPDLTTVMCSERYESLKSGQRRSLPYCVSVKAYHDPLEDFYSTYYDAITMPYQGAGVYFIPTRGNETHYLTFHDIAIDSLRHASLMLRYHSSRTGIPITLGVLDDALDLTTFTPVDTVFTEGGSGWHYALFDLSSYSGNGRWLHLVAGNTTTNDTIYISNFNIEPCHASMGATASLYRWNIVKIDNPLVSQDAPPDFYVEYGPASTSQDTILHVTSLPVYLTLATETIYNFRFRCDSLGTSCTETNTVKTLAGPLSVPSCTDFDTAATSTNLRSWTVSGSGIAVSDTIFHSSLNSLRLPVAQNTLVATPDLNLDSVHNALVSLWMTADSTDSRLVVGTVSDPADPATFHPLRTVSTPQAGTWVRCLVSLAPAPPDAHFLAFRTTCSNPADAGIVFIDDLYIDTCGAFGLTVSTLSADSITLSWYQVGHPEWRVESGEWRVQSSEFGVQSSEGGVESCAVNVGVSPSAATVIVFASHCGDTSGYCNLAYSDTVTLLAPARGTGCIDATNLQSPQALFLSGTCSNPYANPGAVDFGSLDPGSRHTVCLDTTLRDPRTGGLLRLVPEGYTSSLRLGNWTSNAFSPEAEGVVYSLLVDTADFQLLLLRYAAVLQDPMHAPEDQPRFRLEVLDSTLSPVDPLCAAADFVADQSLGWNVAGDNVLWKDWTPVGIDLTPWHGQQVYVRLTTFDCNEGSHYGYAYFTLECMHMQLKSDTCGEVDTLTFTAPTGFNYRWYSADNPSVTLSVAQSLTVPSSPTTYYCELSAVGNCRFTISVWAGPQMPPSDTTAAAICDNQHYLFRGDSIPAQTITQSSSQTVTLTATSPIPDAVCDSLHVLRLTVNPTYRLTDSVVICPHRPFYYQGTDYGGPVSLDTMHSSIHGCDSLVHLVLAPRDSNYRPQVIYGTRDTAWVQISPLHEGDSTGETGIVLACVPDTLRLRDTSAASAAWLWTWHDGIAPASDTASETFIPLSDQATVQSSILGFSLIVTDTFGCLDTLSRLIYTFRRPQAEFDWTPQLPAIDKPEVQFINLSNPPPDAIYAASTFSYLWNIQREAGGEYDTSTLVNPYYHWGTANTNTAGDYEVQLIAYWTHTYSFMDNEYTHTCPDTARHIVTIVNDYLQFPNLVTPNGDGSNDTWRIVNLLEIGDYPINELWIYSAWGVLVYHVRNISRESDFWDPNATASPDGTYYYRFSGRGSHGLAKRNGVIEVLRD